MKKFFVSTIFVFLLSSFMFEAFAQKITGVSTYWVIGRPKYSCTQGLWLCKLKKVTIKVKVEASIADADGEFEAKGVSSDAMPIDPETGKQTQYFFAEAGEEFDVPEDICKELGYKSIKLIPGKYNVDYSVNPYGTVKFKCISEKL